jgi:soluble lytic murein transglycosylase-like protein
MIPLLSLFLCSLFFVSCGGPSKSDDIKVALAEISSIDDNELPKYLESLDRIDPIAPYYKGAATRDDTLAFFSSLTRSENIARVILDNSEKFGVRPSLAFALALEESDFQVDAYNKNGDSVDRGLFQLNSKSYPNLAVQDFYDPGTNARYGISHLKSCLSEAGNEVAGLAMYNAGNGRVRRGATPKKTLNYVSRILAYEDNISSLFAAKVMAASKPAAPGIARLVADSVSMGLIADTAAKKN